MSDPMYLPRHFEEDRIEVLAEFLRHYRFATLVSLAGDGLIATHLPLLWDPEPAPFGRLTGHFARPNPHGRELAGEVDSLAIFQGPQAYISPSWYATKRETGKVVPTWNYLAVHAYGPLRMIDDPQWLRALITRLTDLHEDGLADPWRVTDAPEAFIASMVNGIVGLEMTIRRLEGKWKLGQNRSAADRAGVIEGLRARGDANSLALAREMAALPAR